MTADGDFLKRIYFVFQTKTCVSVGVT